MRLVAAFLLVPCVLAVQALCTVEGQVLNAISGAPLRNVSVLLDGAVPSSPSYVSATDAAGKFAFKDIEPGKYQMTVAKNGFVPMSYGARAPLRTGTTLTLAAAQHMKGVDFHLTPFAIVTGRVLDEGGEPVPYASIQLLRFQYLQGKKQPGGSGSTNVTTNDLGDYRAFDLAPGKYLLSATPREQAGQAPDGYVSTYYPHTVDVTRAAQIDVTAGVVLAGINLTLSKAHMVHVKGHVTAPGAARGLLQVVIVPRTSFGPIGPVRNYIVDATRNFDIQGVAPGSYSLNAYTYVDGKVYSTRVLIEVSNVGLDNVSLVINPGVDVAGRVKIDGESQKDISNIYVRLQQRERGVAYGTLPSGRLQGDNSFLLKDTPANVYDVTITGMPDGFYVKSIRSGQTDVVAEGLEVFKSAAPLLDVVISPNAAQIAGVVKNPETDEPASTAAVTLVPQEKDRQDKPSYYKIVSADQNGEYTFKNLPPGDYKVFAWEDIEPGAYMDPDYVKPFNSKGEAAAVQEGERKTVSRKLIAVDSAAK